MKTKSIISLLVFCMTLGMLTTSCEDMLTPDSERHSYKVASDTLYSYWGIVKSLQNIAERYVILNECRADLVDGTGYVSDTIAAILNFGQNGYEDKYQDGACKYLRISDYYHVINSCNAYIAQCDTFRTTGTDRKYMIREYSQVQAIRAWVYMQLVYAYGEVPFYKEPLLTTDAINDMANNPNRQMANAGNLVDLLGSDLISMEYVERRYGFPFYNMYGDTDPNNSNFVCHSSKVMFPVSLVLGDLYLMKGDEASCREAALHYYNFLNDENGGPLLTSYYSRANMREGEDQPTYIYNATPYNEKYENSRFYESITCIPSNKGKLDGNVNTDISRLFGFEPRTSTSGSGDDVSSQVALTLNFERQLVASKGYDALCDSQKYEVYIGDSNNPFLSLEVMPGIGDARRSWIMDVDGQQYVGRLGNDRVYGTFVSKQNPGYSFSTVYPVVYRRSQVWLRFAEALNRAGYPSYAFAILKNGLCQNDYWYPREEDYEPEKVLYRWINTDEELDIDTIPAQGGHAVYEIAELLQKDVIDAYAAYGIEPDDIKNHGVLDSSVVLRKNYASAYDRTCYYLDHRELEKSRVEPFLNFNTYYMEPMSSGYTIVSKTSMYGFSTTMTRYPTSSISDFYVTVGIHQNGCGRVRYDERAQSGVESVYNYVDQVAKKIKENHGRTVTKEDIYGDDETVRGYVIEAVEDLIVDECGLELAFEGSRFSDLARVSLRRGDPSYLAKRVAKRGGEMDMGLYNYLSQSPKHWYLPFPTE